MADGFYTNDEDYPGCFGGYGTDGADALADEGFGGDFGHGQPPDAGRADEPGVYAAGRARRFWRFGPFTRPGGNGAYGRAA